MIYVWAQTFMPSGTTGLLNFSLSIYSGCMCLRNPVSDTGLAWASLSTEGNLGRMVKINKIVICKNKCTFFQPDNLF